MTKVVMRRQGFSLVPAEDEAGDMLARMTEGKDVVVEVKQSRNIRAHRLFWGLMTILAENLDWLPGKEAAATMIKVATHEVDTFIDATTGEVFYEPRSISFESMDQDRFSRFLDRALFVITQRWMIGNTPEELRQRVYELIDGPEANSLGKRVVRAREMETA